MIWWGFGNGCNQFRDNGLIQFDMSKVKMKIHKGKITPTKNKKKIRMN